MPTIVKETGTINYDNTAIKMQERIEGDDLYSPLYPRELASNIKWNENTLTLPNETGNSTYETKYRGLDFVYAGQYVFAINNSIYKYLPSTKTLNRIYEFYDELGEDYFVDVSMREGGNTSTFYLITYDGKIYSFPANNWFDTGLSACTGIYYVNNQIFVTTQHGLYKASWNDTQSFAFTQVQVANFAIDESFVAIDSVMYGASQQLVVIAANSTSLGAVASSTNPTTFTKLSTSVSNRFHGYKNIIPILNLVVFTDGVWHTTDTTDSALNTGNLRSLKDTQYIYYIKQWSASHYSTSNNKWSMTVDYDAAGNMINNISYNVNSPIYVLFNQSSLDWCLTIMSNGAVMHTTQSDNTTTVRASTVGYISEVYYRAPRYNYHIDMGDDSNSTQSIMQNVNDAMVQEGRIFDNITDIPFTFANYGNRNYLTSEPIISENKMQCLYNAQTTDVYIYRDRKWTYVNIIDKLSTNRQCYSLYSNYCWYDNCLWGLIGITGKSAPYIFRYNPVTDNIYYYATNVSTTNASPLAGWCITVNSDNVVFSTGWVYPDGDDDSVLNSGIYSTTYTSNLDNASWTKVAVSTNLLTYTAINNLQSVKLNGENFVYAISTTGYDDDKAEEAMVSRLISNTLMQVHDTSVLGKSNYQYISPIKVGKVNGTDVALIPDYLQVYYTSDFTNVTIKRLNNNILCPRVQYLSQHNKWVVYEGSTSVLENATIQYQYQILNNTDLSALGTVSTIDLSKLVAINNMMCTNMTPWIIEQDTTYINIFLSNGMVERCTLSTANQFVVEHLAQSYVNSDYITLQKVIKGVDKYILLYTYKSSANYIPKSSSVVYSNNGTLWYGGYNFGGYYNDMCYSNGQLWLGGYGGIDGNTTFVPTILHSGEMSAGSVDMINYDTVTITDANLSIDNFVVPTTLYNSIATSGASVCMATSYNGTTALSYIILGINNDSVVSSALANLQGNCTKIVAGTSNSYFYVLNTSSQRILQELTINNTSITRATVGTYNVLDGMIGQASEYDPVHDGIYIIRDFGVDIYTQGRLFHIGSFRNVSNANQVGWFHGRYLYNISVGSTTKSAYGIVPWFNSYPHDCKYLPMTIQKLCICEDKCFVISDDNKLYISSAI